ncbi:uncharacterized protein EI90DRAFT_3151994 [Cantharellus anzutake]|uniref:uncharacterized protein n=1 Tax=Cantharellus anzutake TaxID=1750568 RepID=UPI001905698E|nr:uncharacterized protein EI90DRAFT_3151994 [Cantharellus anzutake]KAF8338252.1 hypothetical protein EI90DRAFT_3151994 [Cantharellus anzutake]
MPFSKSHSETQRPAALGGFDAHVQRVREQRERERAAALAEVFPGLIMAPASPLPPQVKVVGLSPYNNNNNNKSASTTPHPAASSLDSRSTHDKFRFVAEASSSDEEEDEDFPRLASPRKEKKSKGQKEPNTLSRMLFRFGFLMPVFWLLGALILVLPLKHHPLPRANSISLPIEEAPTSEDIEAHLNRIRRAELKWAWRSLYALVVVVVTLLFVICVWLGLSGRWNGF